MGNPIAPGDLVKSKSQMDKLEDGQTIFVQWPDNEWKGCVILENHKGSLTVETPSGGRLKVDNPKALRHPKIDRGW